MEQEQVFVQASRRRTSTVSDTSYPPRRVADNARRSDNNVDSRSSRTEIGTRQGRKVAGRACAARICDDPINPSDPVWPMSDLVVKQKNRRI